jgi:hypothetical protein
MPRKLRAPPRPLSRRPPPIPLAAGGGTRSWAFLNSPFGLWLLGAVVVMVGSAASGFTRIASEQTAYETSVTTLRDKYTRVERELSDRVDRLYPAVIMAEPEPFPEFEKLRRELEKPEFAHYKEFDGRTQDDLNEEARHLLSALHRIAIVQVEVSGAYRFGLERHQLLDDVNRLNDGTPTHTKAAGYLLSFQRTIRLGSLDHIMNDTEVRPLCSVSDIFWREVWHRVFN